ncbi:MAG: ornithine carbamoyltransferase [Candidatus Bipolaricaulota bacterium]|nr:ornithine carbamoyltransferase [Candidatus Bipolaricaulota bacterium]MCS7274164.1 ornithine carbamoyltransferase [Candidatus Bipolaricaulota bacterium]MDW8111423.1 ornithine carbamoyltransferase [Candidatus Bipolaricaulota bacterium]MDW8329937.1 ornithine carbamoyltransferase [Candidatus Bipolaricaulota bacterium]
MLEEVTEEVRSMHHKDLISFEHYSAQDLWEILETALQLKRELRAGIAHRMLEGKTLAMIFQKPSLRTRVSFEVGMTQLGGHAIYLSPDDIKLGQRETTEDIAKVLSRYCDAIMARVFGHEIVEELARYADVPVINGLSDLLHPCQILGDLLTVYEKKRRIENLKLAWIGDGNNVCNSWLEAGPKLGMEIVVACPAGYEPNAKILEQAQRLGKVEIVHDPKIAAKDADILYTDVWTSMGQEREAEERRKRFRDFQINRELLKLAKPEAIVMHCLPAHYDEEITHDVAHGPQSAIFDEAENRLHAQKAVLALLMR